MALTKDQILAVQDIKTESVNVPEWGGIVLVRGMTGAQRDAYEQSLMASRGADQKANISNIRARLVAFSVVDDDGDLMFSEENIEALGQKSVAALDRVVDTARRLSAVMPEDVKTLGEPSAPIHGASSASDSLSA